MTQVEILAEARKNPNFRHGHATTKHETNTYESWQGMKRRCDNPNRADFKYYGGRGISYCSRWAIFSNFLADMGECPKGMTLDRKHTNGNYNFQNCRWATRREQRMNTRQIRWIKFRGKKMCLRDWERELGFCSAGLTMRLKRGWSILKAMTTPPRKGGIAYG